MLAQPVVVDEGSCGADQGEKVYEKYLYLKKKKVGRTSTVNEA